MNRMNFLHMIFSISSAYGRSVTDSLINGGTAAAHLLDSNGDPDWVYGSFDEYLLFLVPAHDHWSQEKLFATPEKGGAEVSN